MFEDDYISTDGDQRLSTVDSIPAGGGKVTVLTPNDTSAHDPTFGPARTLASISGTVTNEVSTPSVPAADVTVDALDSSGTVAGTVVTDSSGDYKLDLSPGTYTVEPFGIKASPESRTVNLTATTTGIDFDSLPVGTIDLGGGLSFGMLSFPQSSFSGGNITGASRNVVKETDRTSAALEKATSIGRVFAAATVDVFVPHTTVTSAVLTLEDATIESFRVVGVQPLIDDLTIHDAKELFTQLSCVDAPASDRLAVIATALVCPLTSKQKADAQAALTADAQNVQDSRIGLGCTSGGPDRETRLACAAVGVLYVRAQAQLNADQMVLEDPPDSHFKTIAKPRPVHVAAPDARYAAFNPPDPRLGAAELG